MTLNQLLEKQYGVKTTYRINPEVTQIETSATKVLSFNPNRLGFLIINLGAQQVYLSPERTVSSTEGILLAATGGAYTAIWNEDFELTSFEWFAIAVGAATACYVFEIYTE